MPALTLELESEGFDTLYLDDMGDDCAVLSQRNNSGAWERVAVSMGQLRQATEALATH